MPTARALQAQSFRVILIVVPCVFVLQMMCLIPVGTIMISVVFALTPDAHILLSWQAQEVGNRTSWTSSKLEAGSLRLLGREWSQNWQIVGHKHKAPCSVCGQLGFCSRVPESGCKKIDSRVFGLVGGLRAHGVSFNSSAGL